MKRVLLTLAVVALGGITLYASAGFFLAPRLVAQQLAAMVERNTELTLAVETVKLNPFSLTLSLTKVTLIRPESTAVAAFERLEARVRPRTVGLREWRLRDVAIRGLTIAAADPAQLLLSVPSVRIPLLDLERAPAGMRFGAARLDGPRLRLQRGHDGAPALPPEIISLLSEAATGAETRYLLDGGALEFSDRLTAQPLTLAIDGIDGTIAYRSPEPAAAVGLSLRGSVADGAGEISAEWIPSQSPGSGRLALAIDDLELAQVSPYVAEAIGRGVRAGRMDLEAEMVLDRATLALDNRIVLRSLELGEAAGNPALRDLPVALAAALLEDSTGRIELEVPVPEHPNTRAPLAVFSDALASRVTALAEAPFERLASVAGRADPDLDRIFFAPGSADTAGDGREKLAALDLALDRRPKLALLVHPGFDPAADREALARQQIRLHVNLATSEITPTRAAGKPIDPDDPQVRDVLDEFGANRLPARQWAAIGERFPERGTARYRAVLAALIANETVSRPALERLARYRARTVVDALLRLEQDPRRIRQAPEVAVNPPDGEPGAVVRLSAQTFTATPTATPR